MVRRRDRDRALLGLLAAVAFCVFIVEQAPHLVHHFFEPDQVQPECPFAAAGERQPGAAVAPAVLGSILPSTVPLPPLPAAQLAAPARATASARAPPFAS